MIQDQLTRAQRVRLEALSQAMAATGLVSPQRPKIEDIFENAKRIEAFLKEARDDA